MFCSIFWKCFSKKCPSDFLPSGLQDKTNFLKEKNKPGRENNKAVTATHVTCIPEPSILIIFNSQHLKKIWVDNPDFFTVVDFHSVVDFQKKMDGTKVSKKTYFFQHVRKYSSLIHVFLCFFFFDKKFMLIY